MLSFMDNRQKLNALSVRGNAGTQAGSLQYDVGYRYMADAEFSGQTRDDAAFASVIAPCSKDLITQALVQMT